MSPETGREGHGWWWCSPLPWQGWFCLVLLLAAAALGLFPGAGECLAAVEGTEDVAVPEPTPEAVQFYKSGQWLWAFGQVWGIAVPGVVLLSGLGSRMASWCRRVVRRRFLVPSCQAMLLVLVVSLVDLPLSYYAGFARKHAYGLSEQSLARWFGHWLLSLGLAFLTWGVVGGLLFWAIRRSPRWWWLLCGVGAIPLMAVVILVEPIWIDPLFYPREPLREEVLEARIRGLAEKAGIGDARIVLVRMSQDTKAVNARVTGLGGTHRIELWDTLLSKLDEAEVLAVVSHEIGHYVLKHVVKGLGVASLLVLLGLYLVQRGSQWVLWRWGGRLGVTSLGDVESLPLLLVTARVVVLLLVPLGNAYSRSVEREADRYGLELTRNNAAAARSFAKLQETNLGYPWPGGFHRVFRGTHPSLGERITFCNQYRPWASEAGAGVGGE